MFLVGKNLKWGESGERKRRNEKTNGLSFK
jgi:hypothetical protein